MLLLSLTLFSSLILFASAVWEPSPNTRHSRDASSSRHHQISRELARRDTAADLKTLRERRSARVIGSIYDAGSIGSWLNTLGGDGKWPDSEINYATQCAAQRSNWPAFEHWRRIVTMSSAYAGIPGVDEWTKNAALQTGISNAMNWWFARDFNANPQCQDHGGDSLCPCDASKTPSTWMFNTNWFSNIILIPRLVGQACLLVNSTLSTSQFSSCKTMTTRAYANFFHTINGGSSTGANLLDIASIGIDGGVLSGNVTQITDAYNRIHSAIAIVDSGDGIHVDGSFGQHDGLLYNGNYGKDFSNAVMAAEVASAGTQWAGSSANKAAFETLFKGNRWMIYRNILTKVLHWDLSPLVRMITFSVLDDRQGPSSILTNLTEVKTLGELWGSDVLKAYANDLAPNTSNPNAGGTTGINVFWTNDYVVARGENYVTSLKMFSTRTKNTECTNSQNLKGTHLADGAVYTYIDGGEYEDVVQAWDWELIPGTTSDYGGTALNCDNTGKNGLSAIVGGASDGQIATAAMSFTNPVTKALSWNKAWFFLEDDVQYVLVNSISSSSGKSVVTTLDQKKHSGDVQQFDVGSDKTAVWHNGVGYVVPKNSDFTLAVSTANRQGDWSSIGTSVAKSTTVDMFTAKVTHNNLVTPLGYAIFPAIDFATFQSKASYQVVLLYSGTIATIVYNMPQSTLHFVFWTSGSVSVSNPEQSGQKYTVASSGAAVGFVKTKTGNFTIADPTQKATSLTFQFVNQTSVIQLPSGRDAGKSVQSTFTGYPLKPSMVSGGSTKCVNIAGASYVDGTAVQIYDCNGSPAQQFIQGTEGPIKPTGNQAFCLDAGSARALAFL
ncbi:polysaccharide lyase family 8 protein [Flagelloscypha sp. PMI_526]|nr:polysaccharide lyase family 8 protein [Flagelloscypha sp. PMI_526]